MRSGLLPAFISPSIVCSLVVLAFFVAFVVPRSQKKRNCDKLRNFICFSSINRRHLVIEFAVECSAFLFLNKKSTSWWVPTRGHKQREKKIEEREQERAPEDGSRGGGQAGANAGISRDGIGPAPSAPIGHPCWKRSKPVQRRRVGRVRVCTCRARTRSPARRAASRQLRLFTIEQRRSAWKWNWQ